MKAVLSALFVLMSAAPGVAADGCVEIGRKCVTEKDRHLSLRLNDALPDLTAVWAVPWVSTVRVHGDGRVVDLRPLLALEGLSELALQNVELADPTILGALPVARLRLSQMSLPDLGFLGEMSGLRSLGLVRVTGPAPFDLSALPPVEDLAVVDTKLASLDGIAGQAALRDLTLADTGQADLAALSSLNLRRAILRGEGLVDLSFLSGSPDLGFLFLTHAEVTSLDGVPFGPAFRNLGAQGSALQDISALSAAVNIERIDLRESLIRDLSGLEGLSKLEELDLRATALSDLSPLVDLPSLKRLDLSDTQVEDLSPLAGLTSVETMSLSRIPATDLGPLAAMDQVKALWLNETRATDLSPLLDMDSLEAMRIDDAQFISKEGLPAYMERRPVPTK